MGATGIQVIQTIADEVAHLTVFTRTTQYVLPMKSPAYGPEEQAAYKSRFDELKATIPHPFTYGFGTHRVPLERNYLEVYHQPNVELVGVRDNPIARIVPEGIELADGTVPRAGRDRARHRLRRRYRLADPDRRARPRRTQPHRRLGPRHPPAP